MRRLLAIVLTLFAAAPVGAILDSGTALAAATGPALVPGAIDHSVTVKTPDLDASDRWIVVLRDRGPSHAATLNAAAARAKGLGIHQDHVFKGTFRGYSARLTNAQLALLRADARVETVVPDDIISLTGQTTPTGVSRVYGPLNPIAQIDGHDTRVNADVAIVDTGIDPHHVDLNVAGGYSCSTSSTSAWGDGNGHGTHVAGIVGALDNGIGVVGVAPGVRLWAVRILDTAGNGLLSWYVCGLDWIAAQKDPNDPTRPLFEAVNMSVAKPGRDDGNCGYTNSDVMHRAVCRVVNAGITVVAAAGNNSGSAAAWVPAAYNEVITVSALADTDGKPGGLGGNACFSWNSYDKDDTFADFSNYGSDVDIIAPGKCILSTLPGNTYGVKSGTSMAAPLVAGAAALYKSTRPNATPADVKQALISMGSHDWKWWTDPDPWHEPLLDVSWIVDAGDFAMRSLDTGTTVRTTGATLKIPMNVVRAEDFNLPLDLTATVKGPVTASLSVSHFAPGDPNGLTVTVTVPPDTPDGPYPVTVTASDGSRQRSAVYRVIVDTTAPVATSATLGPTVRSIFYTSYFYGAARWTPATDDYGGIAGYQARWIVDGHWGPIFSLSSTARAASRTFAVEHHYQFLLRARDAVGNWSPWVTQPVMRGAVVQDTSRIISRTSHWVRVHTRFASGGTYLYTPAVDATYSLRFYGRGIAIVAPLGPGRGTFDVSIDGVKVATVDELAAGYLARRIIYVKTGLVSGVHTMKVAVNATPGRQRMDLDALLILK